MGSVSKKIVGILILLMKSVSAQMDVTGTMNGKIVMEIIIQKMNVGILIQMSVMNKVIVNGSLMDMVYLLKI